MTLFELALPLLVKGRYLKIDDECFMYRDQDGNQRLAPPGDDGVSVDLSFSWPAQDFEIEIDSRSILEHLENPTYLPALDVVTYEPGLEYTPAFCWLPFRDLLFINHMRLLYVGITTTSWKDFYVMDDFGNLVQVDLQGARHYRLN